MDDEKLARERIKDLLKVHHATLEYKGEADNGARAIQLIESQHPELIFLDIQMPDMSGFEMLGKLSYQPKIIFATAYSKYAIQAFENLTLDYLVKPITQQQINRSVNKLKKLQGQTQAVDLAQLQELLNKTTKQKESLSFAVKKGDRIILLDYEDITHFQALDKYVNIYLSSGDVHLTEKPLHTLEATLPDNFFRIHRSVIINKSYIKEIQKYFKGTLILTLNNPSQTKLKSSQKYSQTLKQQLGII